ncbi:LytR C-terminal domain-containing protein [Cellulomonas fimi]|uniref:LytR/CpsA/Psr regulator C-terminal domain-containing protein n=1 Tax=Cellulomonas fimi (strain ATCC 484 / DSM 20113 / JCM 1341 / CCUG 24087 / LMG 16345 / NBRC 15513 / NCIMB 8980 / NCTC 7547 / NRS-133) TaxID=590998 RepID=F4H2E2_CELFA|nr:LytR C-terminal domain-containing protein [Cellulomonas fimi]AEE47562.1 hypothetical protein Celf_3450 [Cellulomonas fimi ATCC 484]NNH07929.1 LytR C-terminal domain-containing protein [Cellulomonas fimi]VEH36540.1 Uncharacterised protein [Cellulomonas fimi]
MSDVDRARALRRRHMHERQAVIFGVLLAGLAVAGLGAAAVYTGNVSLPFVARGFSTPPPEPAAPVGPCPPANALPVAYAQVSVNVLNGTSSVGLAGATAEELRLRGFTVAGTANSEAGYEGVALISFGVNGAAAAYTLAAQVDGADMLLVAREDAGVDITLGSQWPGLLPTEQVLLDPAAPLVGPEGCTPLEESAVQTPEAPAAQG